MTTDRDTTLLFAPTRAGYDLPVINVTHPHFAIAEDDASLASMREAFL